MQAAGVEAVADARSLAVVGIVEVLGHIPRIYGEFRKLVRAAKARRPDLAILTDSPDFHLRLAKKLHAQGVPVVYLDRSAGMGVETEPRESDAADSGSAAMYFPL